MYVLYVASLIKSVISLHSLINNKLHNKEFEAEQQLKEKEAEDEKLKKQEASAKKAEDFLNSGKEAGDSKTDGADKE
jgi:26S proteasome regulatory subunit N8